MFVGQSYIVQTEYPGYVFSIRKNKKGIISISSMEQVYLSGSKLIKESGVFNKLEKFAMTRDIEITGTIYGENIFGNPLGIKGIRFSVDLIKFEGNVAGVTAMLMIANKLGLELSNYNVIGTNKFNTSTAIDYYLSMVNSKRYRNAKYLDDNDYGKMPVLVNVFHGSNYSFTKEELQLMADNNKYPTNNSYAKGINVKPLRTMPTERFEIFNYKSQKYNNKQDERLVS